ncbi:MAG: YihA family ribosome biogenesis GTP-binding protein [Alphaproteobacteria bacterium]|nr:YihA family ribosome biogenesis GTP-binding protein [Alphaproteobacteria bacterium]
MSDSLDHNALAAAPSSLKGQPCDFVTSVVSLKTLPPMTLPEIAFAGRSNVGKSSLINALVGRTGLARTSNTPGRTQQLNFFNWAGLLYLVDMPGYGYAKAPKEMVAAWTRLVKDYLRGRVSLKRVFLLIDARHGLMKNDLEVMKLLNDSAVSYQVVLTKMDKLSKAQQEQISLKVSEAIAKHPAAYPTLITTSSQKDWGLDELRSHLETILRPELAP